MMQLKTAHTVDIASLSNKMKRADGGKDGSFMLHSWGAASLLQSVAVHFSVIAFPVFGTCAKALIKVHIDEFILRSKFVFFSIILRNTLRQIPRKLM